MTHHGDDAGEARLVQALDALATVQLELDRARVQSDEATELLDRLLSAMSDAFVLVDARGVVVRVNEAALALFGTTRADTEGRPVQRLLGPDVPSSTWELLERDPAGRLPVETTLRLPSREVPVSLSCSIVRDPSGKVVGTLYLGRDVSETHRLLEEVERGRARWRLIAEIGEELTESVDVEGALPAVCERVAGATGYGMAIVLVSGAVVDGVFVDGRSAESGAVPLVPQQPLEPRTALATVVREGRVVHASVLPRDYPLLRLGSNGEAMASAVLVPIIAKGTCLGAVVLFSDRPEGVDGSSVNLVEEVARRVGLVLANARLRASLAELEAGREVARAREEILAGLSHDMKTPLAVLVGALDILRGDDEIAPDRQQMLYDAMASQAYRLRRLVLQFLDYTRMESGRPLAVDLCPADVATLIRQAVDTFDGSWEVRLDLESDLAPVMVDPDRFDQVLSNLLSNAVKFSPTDSPVWITARQVGDRVEVAVIDRGKGIAPNDLANLFDKYYRGRDADGSTGTGLGLYMSRALMEAQGGSITVGSRLGQGSTFTLSVPIAAPA